LFVLLSQKAEQNQDYDNYGDISMSSSVFIALGAAAIGLVVTFFCIFLAMSNKKKKQDNDSASHS
jgi:hypothetical protein